METAGVADTRLLLTLEFPPDSETKRAVEHLFRKELGSRLLAPSVVLAEFIKIAGPRMGRDSARARLSVFRERGMQTAAIGEREALLGGDLLLKHPDAPVADALIASFVVNKAAEYVVTDDPHFRALGVRTRWF